MSEHENEVKRRVLVGVRWSLIAKLSGQTVSWVSTFIVIRLLTPEDYGLMGMAQIVLATLMMFTVSGVGDGIIQAKSINKDQLHQFFSFVIILNLSLSALTYLGAPFVAAYYSEPRVETILQVQAAIFIIQIFIALPNALLSREINFKQASIVNLIASLSGVCVTLTLAYLDYGVWALVFGVITTSLTRAIGLNIVRPCLIMPVFKFDKVGGLIRFGLIATLNTLIWSIYLRADIFISGRFFDTETVGIYVIALTVATLSLQKIMPIITPLALPFFSRLQHDEGEFQSKFIQYMRVSVMLIYPVAVGTAAIAPEFVPLVLGEKWTSSITSMILLSFAVLPHSAINLFSPALRAKDKAIVSLVNGLCTLTILVTLFLLALPWGIEGIAASWLIGASLSFSIALIRSSKALEIAPSLIIKQLVPPLCSSAIMYLGVRVISTAGIGTFNHWIELVLMTVGGAAIYALGIRLIAPDSFSEILKLRKLLAKAKETKGKSIGAIE